MSPCLAAKRDKPVRKKWQDGRDSLLACFGVPLACGLNTHFQGLPVQVLGSLGYAGQNSGLQSLQGHGLGDGDQGAQGHDVPHHFTGFHPSHKMMDLPSTTSRDLNRAREIAMENGERYVYTGNVHDPAGQTTYCHACRAVLIERDRYRLGRWELDADGRCATCSTPCAGVFEAEPGTWGGRRLPVRLAERE